MKKQELISTFAPIAQELQRQHGVFTSITLAQLILESGWLAYVPTDIHTGQYSYNCFGVKGKGTAGSVYVTTTEVYVSRAKIPAGARNIFQRSDGKWQFTIEDYFAAYNSYYESLLDHADFLLRNPRYKPVLAAKDGREAAKQLQACGYATDPNYADKLISLMQSNDLFKYDSLPDVEEDDEMRLEDWQWTMLGDALKELGTVGFGPNNEPLVSYSWAEKAYKKELTTSELLFLMPVMLARLEGFNITTR